SRNDLRVKWFASVSTPAANSITGFNSADTIRGGGGNDALNGAGGSDTYIWARGDGNDTITETTFNGTADCLLLEGLTPADVTLSRSGNNITVTVRESTLGAGDGGSILLVNSVDPYYEQGVDLVRFGDGTVWTQSTLRQMLVTAAGTSGDDNIVGTAAADIIRA